MGANSLTIDDYEQFSNMLTQHIMFGCTPQTCQDDHSLGHRMAELIARQMTPVITGIVSEIHHAG